MIRSGAVEHLWVIAPALLTLLLAILFVRQEQLVRGSVMLIAAAGCLAILLPLVWSNLQPPHAIGAFAFISIVGMLALPHKYGGRVLMAGMLIAIASFLVDLFDPGLVEPIRQHLVLRDVESTEIALAGRQRELLAGREGMAGGAVELGIDVGAVQPRRERVGLRLPGLRGMAAAAFGDRRTLDLGMRGRERQAFVMAALTDARGGLFALRRRALGKTEQDCNRDGERHCCQDQY